MCSDLLASRCGYVFSVLQCLNDFACSFWSNVEPFASVQEDLLFPLYRFFVECVLHLSCKFSFQDSPNWLWILSASRPSGCWVDRPWNLAHSVANLKHLLELIRKFSELTVFVVRLLINDFERTGLDVFDVVQYSAELFICIQLFSVIEYNFKSDQIVGVTIWSLKSGYNRRNLLYRNDFKVDNIVLNRYLLNYCRLINFFIVCQLEWSLKILVWVDWIEKGWLYLLVNNLC